MALTLKAVAVVPQLRQGHELQPQHGVDGDDGIDEWKRRSKLDEQLHGRRDPDAVDEDDVAPAFTHMRLEPGR